MVYLITGNKGTNKSEIGTHLYEFLKTCTRNWRREVFYLDESEIRNLHNNSDNTKGGMRRVITDMLPILMYLNARNLDVVLSIMIPDLESYNLIKETCTDDICEILLYSTDAVKLPARHVTKMPTTDTTLLMNTTRKRSVNVFSKLLHYIK